MGEASGEPTASHPLATGLPLVSSEGGCPLSSKWDTVLALWSLAALLLGQLETAGATELQTLRCAVLLVSQPQEYRLQRLRCANDEALTLWRKGTPRHDRMIAEGASRSLSGTE